MARYSESYDIMSESQQGGLTQTQDSQAQQSSPPPAFPSNLWGILVSYSPSDSGSVEVMGGSEQPTAPRIPRAARLELEWDKLAYKVGRHPKADLVLHGAKISSFHARIFYDSEQRCVKLEDTSSNGTWVRNQKVAKGNVTILESGDPIIFGPATTDFANDFRYVFQGPSPHQSSTEKGLQAFEGGGGGLFERYEVREQIGKGSFASVRKGVQKKTGQLVAIKIIEKARFASNPNNFKMFAREVDIMKSLEHKFCVKCLDVFEDTQRIWIVLEYVDGGDLLDYVMRRKGLNEDETREIARMVCDAMAYLHSRGIAHRDLKPENLLLTKGMRPLCKVTDFGLAKIIDEGTMLKTMCGTPTYLAPEVILGGNPERGYSGAVDAWSLGVILYACLTNQTPFDEDESTPLAQRMKERKVDFDVVREAGASEDCTNFMSRLLTADPKKRMTFPEALQHPWLSSGSESADGTALPLLVSSLPFNAGHEPSVVASVTSGSFVDSQGMAQLRINGTPAKNSVVTAGVTTPDRSGHDEVTTEAGDLMMNGPVSDSVSAANEHPGQGRTLNGGDFSMADFDSEPKRQEPTSAFSSASDIDEEPARVARHNGSAMSLDAATSSVPQPRSFYSDGTKALAPPPLVTSADAPAPEVSTSRVANNGRPREIEKRSRPDSQPEDEEEKADSIASLDSHLTPAEGEGDGDGDEDDGDGDGGRHGRKSEEENARPRRSSRRSSVRSSGSKSTPARATPQRRANPRTSSSAASRNHTPQQSNATAGVATPTEAGTSPEVFSGVMTRRRAKAARLA